MKSRLIYLLLVMLPLTIFAQEYIQVDTKFNPAKKWKELSIEIVNKSEGEMMIPNITSLGEKYISYFELYFFDKEGQQIPVSYYPPTFGVPFMNAAEIGKHTLIVKPDSSIIFKYSYSSLSEYCSNPDRIKKMQIKYHIKYYIFKNDSLITDGLYEGFSQKISF